MAYHVSQEKFDGIVGHSADNKPDLKYKPAISSSGWENSESFTKLCQGGLTHDERATGV